MLLGEDDIDELRGKVVAPVEEEADCNALEAVLALFIEIDTLELDEGDEPPVIALIDVDESAVSEILEELVIAVSEDDCSPPDAVLLLLVESCGALGPGEDAEFPETVPEGLSVDVGDTVLEELSGVNVVPERAGGVLEAIVLTKKLVEDATGAAKFGLGVRVC